MHLYLKLVLLCHLAQLVDFGVRLAQAQQVNQQQQQQQQQQLLHNNNNDVMPQQYHQHNNILYFAVEENKPNNTFVGTIRSADGQVPYLVVSLPQTPEVEFRQAFTVNYSNGDLTTNLVLDREHREQYHFVAIVKEPFAEIKCTVTVRDVNDNAPMFLTSAQNETNYVIDMPEGQRGVRKVLPLALDFDTPQYGIKEFRIISGNTPSGTFQLVEHEAPARSTLPQNGNLNSAADDTAAAMLAAGADNPQLIQQLAQQATVLIPSQPVTPTAGGQLAQSAPQSSSSSSMGSQQVANTQSKFLIDLEVSQPLDRENQSSYQLVVEAIDGGQPPQFGRLLVTVNVLDINDNDPVFLRKFYECHLSEDTPKGALVHRVQAYDVDLDSNGQVSYYLKRHTASSSSSSSQQQGTSTNSSEYSNELSAGRFAPGTSNKQQQPRGQVQPNGKTAQLPSPRGPSLDGSDTAPAYKARSSLGAAPQPPQPQAAYAPDQLFDIDPNKGEIYLVNQLDFETDQMHELLIEARDHGRPSRVSFTTVKVYVIDVHDDPAPRLHDEAARRQTSGGNSLASTSVEGAKAESSARLGTELSNDLISQQGLAFNNLNFIAGWFAQMNSSLLFGIVLVALLALAFPVCLVKIKSRQPESDYNDTAGLTLASNNGQTKPSPSHSASNIEHANGLLTDTISHHHHDHQRRPLNLEPMGGAFGVGQQNGKMSRHQFTDSTSNHYYNPHPAQHQRARHHSSTSHHHLLPDSPAEHHLLSGPGAGHLQVGGSRGGTMTLSHNHHHHGHLLDHTPPGHHHPLDQQQHQFANLGANLATGSLTYDHSHAALFHAQAQHHRSSHHLSPVHQVALNGGHHHRHPHHNHHLHSSNRGGTMNSVGTHHSAHHPPSSSPMPATPNTTNSSVIQPGNPMHPMDPNGPGQRNPLLPSIPHHHQAIGQLPPTPTHNMNSGVFSWPLPESTLGGCCPPGPGDGGGAGHHLGGLHDTPGSTIDSRGSTLTQQPLDRWLDLGASPQLVNTQDWCGSYNWDYLEDWIPECHTLMPLIQADAAAATAAGGY